MCRHGRSSRSRHPLSRRRDASPGAEQRRAAQRFKTLHDGPPILVLPNVWDVIGARLYETEGFEAVGTTSAGISATLGYPDGQRISLADNAEVVRRICDRTGLLVSADIEGGYSDAPEGAAASARAVLEAGAVGINLEDGTGVADRPLEEPALVAEKIRAIRQTATEARVPLVVNLRTDVYIVSLGDRLARLRETVTRAQVYRDAGADCIFVPDTSGALDADTIGALVREIPAPVNVIAGESTPAIPQLEDLGVARVSFGPRAMRAALALLRRMAREWRDVGTYSAMLADSLTYGEVNAMLER